MAQGVDTKLARILAEQGALEPEQIQPCLAEARQRRWSDPDVSLAVLLLERRLVSPEALQRALDAALEPASPWREDSLPDQFGPYRVVSELARGGMGVVLEVEHRETGARRALKTLLPGMNVEEDVLRFAREAELNARLDHPQLSGKGPVYRLSAEERASTLAHAKERGLDLD